MNNHIPSNFQVPGFKASGIAAGIKKNQAKDLALIYSEVPSVAAGVFTTNRVKAAPVLISRDPALGEVAGDAAVAVDADSTTALARAIVELMRDPQWRGTLRERGIRRAAEFSWRRTAMKTHEVYVEALRRF